MRQTDTHVGVSVTKVNGSVTSPDLGGCTMAGNSVLLCVVQELVTSYWLYYLCYMEKPLPT
jgi:hypothetical protein